MTETDVRRVEVEGIDLSYRDLGEGPETLVLLHGGTGSSDSYWTVQLDYFATRFRVLTLDLRGFGESTAPVGPSIRIEDLAEDLRRLLDHLRIERANVAGLSLGGIVAQQFALDSPSRLAQLVLSDTVPGHLTYGIRSFTEDVLLGVAALGPEGRALAQKINLLFAYSEEYLQSHGKELRSGGAVETAGWSSIDAEAHGHVLRSLFEWNVVDRLGEIAAPTLLVWGSEDLQAPMSYARGFLEGIPRSCLHVIDGAGHKSCVEQPMAWCRAVDAFLSSS